MQELLSIISLTFVLIGTSLAYKKYFLKGYVLVITGIVVSAYNWYPEDSKARPLYIVGNVLVGIGISYMLWRQGRRKKQS